jgi:hypothetical protein
VKDDLEGQIEQLVLVPQQQRHGSGCKLRGATLLRALAHAQPKGGAGSLMS